jgi:hypothetical protein
MNDDPDIRFDKCLALIPLLPATHVNVWGVDLFIQFWHALGEALTHQVAQLPPCLGLPPMPPPLI